MSRDLNDWKGIGRLSKDIDLKYMPNGNAVANISLACGDDYKNKETGEKVERTNWIDIVMFGRSAETLAQYCGKGSRICVSGKLTKRKWQDNDGNNRYTTEIVSNDFQMLDSKPQADQQGGQQQYSAQNQQGGASNNTPASNSGDEDWDDSEIPF